MAREALIALEFRGLSVHAPVHVWLATARRARLHFPSPRPEPPPKGPHYVKLAEQDPDAADVLRVLGQPGPLDWYDIYKAWEIVEHAIGGSNQVEARGWATKADINRLTASANHPGISGDEARHARMKGSPSSSRVMTIGEADALVRRLVANWIESHPLY